MHTEHLCLRAAPAPTRIAARGISLVEMLISLSVMGTLASVATPSFVGILQSSRLSAASNEFLGALRLTRSEALRRGSRVAMCKSADGATCAETGGWEQGWIVFHDPNRNGAPDAGEDVIARGSPAGRRLLLTGNQPVAQLISFAPVGGPRAASGAFLAGTVTLCERSADRAPARQIVMSSSGRVRVQQVTMDSCG
jgi:type IV fimbrial biogenesis protein FimT